MNIIQFFTFGLVGFSGLVVDFGITWLAREKLQWNSYVANGFGFVFGVVNNYFFNRLFTFQNQDPNVGKQFFSFFIIAIIGFFISTAFLYLLQKYTRLHFYVAKFAVTAIVFFWNYTINSLFVFR